MQPWFIATETFTPQSPDAWRQYIAWSGLAQLDEVVTVDGMLCPAVLREIEPDDWGHIVNEDFMLKFFVDLEFLLKRISHIPERDLDGTDGVIAIAAARPEERVFSGRVPD